ncbi:lipocalin-like domain-containing protein [Chryseobacterium paridis]|uniref:Lipocalin family protein n=1 Tax=Chryseobacterium paridis TaxID=2800328 RepID=A0ABS1FWB2_9FLAO|nr:lipocalin family protein [Chryseobacterium paridis]MBK1896711.1 lipocalin family protein [Chryseobacterium paridis]
MKLSNIFSLLFIICLTTISANVFSQKSHKEMIVGKWQPVSSTREAYDFNGNRDVKTDSKFSSNDIMQFNTDGSIIDGGQWYFSYSLDTDQKTLLLFDEAGYEKKFEVEQLDKTTMKLVMRVAETHRDRTTRGIWTLVFKRK